MTLSILDLSSHCNFLDPRWIPYYMRQSSIKLVHEFAFNIGHDSLASGSSERVGDVKEVYFEIIIRGIKQLLE